MTNIFNKFDIFSQISEELKQNIKLFHVFDGEKGYNVLFITNDDSVYGFGSNYFGCCGLGHNTSVDSPLIIPELCHKNIKQFFSGYSFVLALNCDNQLYGWGDNSEGQLAIGIVSSDNKFLKPIIIESLNNEDIVDISCGSAHSLVLTSNGTVFGWGWNEYGQIGCGKQTRMFPFSMFQSKAISTPIQLKSLIDLKIKSIYCSYCRSYVLTNDGLVYSWGWNEWCSLGHELDRNERIFEPKLINISNVISVCPSSNNTYFLTNEGLIYFCGKFKDENNSELFRKIPKLLETETKIISLHSIPYYQNRNVIASAVTEECVYYINWNNISKTKFKTVFDYYSEEYKMTVKSIDIKEFLNESPFKVRYQEICSIGSGGFGTVLKVRDKSNQTIYGIKRIQFNGQHINESSKEELIKVVEVMSKCNPEYVVQYYDSWFEGKCFYIQMELCFDNLDNILKQKSECFGRKTSEPMNSIEFFISSQLFKEVLECVRYLHELKPNPIIHMNLKPHNILVTEKSRNGRFIELCDFGFETLDDMNNTVIQTVNRRTIKYTAPEVMSRSDQKTRYTTKADIFSLCFIANEIFDFDINSPNNTITLNPELSSKWKALYELSSKMLNPVYRLRPTCSDILSEFNDWGIDSINMQNKKQSKHYFETVSQMNSFSNRFFYKYFRDKLLYC